MALSAYFADTLACLPGGGCSPISQVTFLTFLTDGGDDIRDLAPSPQSAGRAPAVLVHLTMRITVLTPQAKALRRRTRDGARRRRSSCNG